MIHGRRVLVAEFCIDLRFGMNRLMGIAFQAGLDPRKGDVILFGGRNRKRLKVLHGDATGVWVSSKVFFADDAQCIIKPVLDGSLKEVSVSDFARIIDGRNQ